MENKLITLKLVLDELGIENNIETIDDRKAIQKAIYLGQLTGVDLGYRFGWYLMGPYCPSLTNDYYAFAEASQTEDEYKNYSLKKHLKDKLVAIKPLLEKYQDNTINLSKEKWLELLASYHFLTKISGMSHEEAKNKFMEQKPDLVEYLDSAKVEIEKYPLEKKN